MRLRQLDLVRYGKFTDRSIDFGEKLPGQPDLHVIYGPNESGKSTAFAAFLDLLFGIIPNSTYSFLHPYSTMRVGGALELGAGTRQFWRVKRQQNSLLDAKDQPIPESSIRGELGNIDRDAYLTMFSLDDESLEKGGKSILASKGDLGQLLFSASAGLAQLGDQLVGLKEEADQFYRYRARSGMLAELKARLVSLKSERETLDTLASDHARLADIRNRTSAQYEEAVAERGRIQKRMDEIQRHLAALPRLTALQRLREGLDELAVLPEAPAGWATELPELQREEIELGVHVRTSAEEIERLDSEFEASRVDETSLKFVERLELLSDLRARYVTAERDLPGRRSAVREVELAISGILQRVEHEGEKEPLRLVLSAATVGRLRAQIEAYSGVNAATKNAEKELLDARSRLEEAAALLPEPLDEAATAQQRQQSMTKLAAAVEAARSGDRVVRQRFAEKALTAANDKLADLLAGLLPWQGTADELVSMRCPTSDALHRWTTAHEEAEKTLTRYEGDLDRLRTQVGRLQAERVGLASTTGVATDQEAAQIRMIREQAWASHRSDLSASSADAFEKVLRQDDIVSAGRISHMSDLAKVNQIEQTLAIALAEVERTTELRNRTVSVIADINAEVAAAATAATPALSSARSIEDLKRWLSNREEALCGRDTLRTAQRELLSSQSDIDNASERLRTSLTQAGFEQGDDLNFEVLLADAQATLDQQAELLRLLRQRDDRRRDVATRENTVEQMRVAEQAWLDAWSTACRSCWLAETGDVPEINVVREILVAIADLRPAIEKRAGLVDRVEKMEKDQTAFRGEVVALANELEIAAGDLPALELAQLITERVGQAIEDQDRRTGLAGKREEAKDRQHALQEKLQIHEQKKQKMIMFFGVPALADVAQKLSEIGRRDELRQRAKEAEHEILDTMLASDLPGAEAALAAADREALETELSELKTRCEDQDKRCHELFAARSSAIDRIEAIGGDARVAEIEERRRTTLLEIEDGAIRHLLLRAGIAAAERAIASYREQHRSTMMERASTAFRAISRGAYKGLAAQPGKDGETLIALGAAGGSKAANELSKGTRFQLYLALRVAGYHEFVRSRSEVPFVADDIMETFDESRTEEAIRLLTEMARSGQVIYFTHHRHVCDIAKKVLPNVRLHYFDEPALNQSVV
jgi:uncharacterized protein YhaN